jgi:hypothetical protein
LNIKRRASRSPVRLTELPLLLGAYVLFLVIAIAIDPATSSGAVGARGGPTGDPATIHYYEQVTNRFNSKPATVEVFRGAFWLGYATPTSWYLTWNRARPQYAVQHAVAETVIAAVAHQHVVWQEITWASPCPAGRACASSITPIRFFLEHHASYWTELDGLGGTASCWTPATGSTAWINKGFNVTGTKPWYVGSSPYTTAPNYGPLTRNGGAITVTSTYRYLNGADVTELDTINEGTGLFTAIGLNVGASGNNPHYAYKGALSIPHKVPKPPHIVICH